MEKVINNGTIVRDVSEENGLPTSIEETYPKIKLMNGGVILYKENEENDKIFVPYFQIYEIAYKEVKPEFIL